tara:strand:- start:1646 stop:2908 length:1263 start_codon:yes stop_codon:yes gene_type:complete
MSLKSNNPNKHLVTLLSTLIYLTPMALLSGPFLPDLFISLSGIIFLYLSLVNRDTKYFRNNFFYFLILFNFFLIFSSLISAEKFHSLSSSLVYFRFIIFSLSIWYILENNKLFLKFFTIALLATFSIALLDGYIQFFFNRNILGLIPEIDTNVRLSLMLNDRLILGGYLARLLPLLFALILLNFKSLKFTLILTSSLLILTDVLIYLSGERTAIALLIISTLLLIFLLSRFNFLRAITFILSILIIIIISLSFSDIKERNIDQTINQMGLNNGTNKIYIVSDAHESYVYTGLSMFYNNMIFGIGPNNYRNFCSDDNYSSNELSCNTHPHNTYIQILAETGLIGLLFILVIVIYIVRSIFKHLIAKITKNGKTMTDFQVCLMICFIVSLFPFIPTQNFFNNWINIIYFFPVGFYLYSKNKN